MPKWMPLLLHSALMAGEKTSFGANIFDIKVNSVNGLGKNGTTMTMGHSETPFPDLFNHMKGIADGSITKAKQKNDIMIAEDYQKQLKMKGQFKSEYNRIFGQRVNG